MIPWGFIIKIASGLLGIFVRNKVDKEKLKRQMYEFIKKHDESISENVGLRREYDEMVKRSKKDVK